MQKWKITKSLKDHKAPVTAVCANESHLISAADNGEILCRAQTDLSNIRPFIGHDDKISGLALAPHGERLFSASFDKTIRIWDTNNNECLQVMEGHSDEIASLALSGDGNTLVSSGYDNTIRIWDAASGECRAVMQGHEHVVHSVDIDHKGEIVVSGSSDKTVRTWDAQRGTPEFLLAGHTGAVKTVQIQPGGEYIVSGGGTIVDKNIRIWDSRSGSCKHVIKRYRSEIRSLALSQDGMRIAGSGGLAGKALRIWDLDGVRQALLSEEQDLINDLFWTQGGQVIAAYQDHTICVWQYAGIRFTADGLRQR